MKKYYPSKGFNFTLAVILLVVGTYYYLGWNYHSCIRAGEDMVLKANPEFINVHSVDDQDSTIYYKGISKEDDKFYYVVQTYTQCNFIGGVDSFLIEEITKKSF